MAKDLFLSQDPNDRVNLIHKTLPKVIAADKLMTKIRKEKRQATPDEQKVIDEAEAAREIIIQVDSFARLGKELNEEASWSSLRRPAYTAGAMATARA